MYKNNGNPKYNDHIALNKVHYTCSIISLYFIYAIL